MYSNNVDTVHMPTFPTTHTVKEVNSCYRMSRVYTDRPFKYRQLHGYPKSFDFEGPASPMLLNLCTQHSVSGDDLQSAAKALLSKTTILPVYLSQFTDNRRGAYVLYVLALSTGKLVLLHVTV